MNKMKIIRIVVCVLLALAMVMTMLPLAAFAQEDDDDITTIHMDPPEEAGTSYTTIVVSWEDTQVNTVLQPYANVYNETTDEWDEVALQSYAWDKSNLPAGWTLTESADSKTATLTGNLTDSNGDRVPLETFLITVTAEDSAGNQYKGSCYVAEKTAEAYFEDIMADFYPEISMDEANTEEAVLALLNEELDALLSDVSWPVGSYANLSDLLKAVVREKNAVADPNEGGIIYPIPQNSSLTMKIVSGGEDCFKAAVAGGDDGWLTYLLIVPEVKYVDDASGEEYVFELFGSSVDILATDSTGIPGTTTPTAPNGDNRHHNRNDHSSSTDNTNNQSTETSGAVDNTNTNPGTGR